MKKKLIEYIEVNGKRHARALVEFRVFVGNTSFLVRKGMISGELGENTILVKAWTTPETKVESNCQIRNSMITDNAIIHGGCSIHHSRIGGNVIVFVNNHISRSTICDYSKVKPVCFIDCCVIKHHSIIGSAARLTSVEVTNYTEIAARTILHKTKMIYTNSYFALPYINNKYIGLELKYKDDYTQLLPVRLLLTVQCVKRTWSQVIKDYDLSAEDQYFITKQFKLHFGDDPKLKILLDT